MKTLRYFAFLFFAAITTATLKAQTTFPVTWSSSNVDYEFRSDGTFIIKGLDTALGLSGTDVGAGTRLLWYPSLSAIRAGTVTTDYWNPYNIGQYSTSFGLDNLVSNRAGTGIGENNIVYGLDSVAIGGSNVAAGNYSIAMGYLCTNHWSGGVAIGEFTNGTGYQATAIGTSCNATNNWALALGTGANATGSESTALQANTASGANAVAAGWSTLASGDRATTFGNYTVASSFASFAIGQYNVGGGSSSTTLVATDPALEIGNGTSASATSDALIVYKNGNATFQGTVNVKPTSDIPMYTGTN